MGPLHIIDKPNNIQEDTNPDIFNAMHTMKSDDQGKDDKPTPGITLSQFKMICGNINPRMSTLDCNNNIPKNINLSPSSIIDDAVPYIQNQKQINLLNKIDQKKKLNNLIGDLEIIPETKGHHLEENIIKPNYRKQKKYVIKYRNLANNNGEQDEM